MIDHKLLQAIRADADAQHRKKEERTGSEKKKWVDRTSTLFITMGLFVVLLIFAMAQGTDAPTETLANAPPPAKAKRIIERRTSAGVPIERGADIDYRIDGDKLINLSVRQIRSNGYRCNSLSNIDLYKYNRSIVVRCNGSKDKYRIYPSSGQVTRY